MKAKVNLHTHDARVSFDSRTPPTVMAKAYERLGYDAVGFVGHDEMSEFEYSDIIIINGIEHTVSKVPEIHIVEFPEHNFSFLAHPSRILAADTSKIADNIIRDRNLDAVERFNNGLGKYDGKSDVPQLANDDAHNLLQIGSSYMEVEVTEPTEANIMRAIKQDRAELKNTRRRVLGTMVKGLHASISRTLEIGQ